MVGGEGWQPVADWRPTCEFALEKRELVYVVRAGSSKVLGPKLLQMLIIVEMMMLNTYGVEEGTYGEKK